MLVLVSGPAGSNKSSYVQEMLDAGEVDVVLDVTQVWAATTGAQRGPDGKFPERDADDPGLHLARYVQTVGAAFALRQGYRTAVTTSQAGQVGRWAAMAAEHGAEFSSRVIDPGEDVVRKRLAGPDGTLSDECEQALSRWFQT